MNLSKSVSGLGNDAFFFPDDIVPYPTLGPTGPVSTLGVTSTTGPLPPWSAPPTPPTPLGLVNKFKILGFEISQPSPFEATISFYGKVIILADLAGGQLELTNAFKDFQGTTPSTPSTAEPSKDKPTEWDDLADICR